MWQIIDTLTDTLVDQFTSFAYAYKECGALNARYYVEVGDADWFMRYTLKHSDE